MMEGVMQDESIGETIECRALRVAVSAAPRHSSRGFYVATRQKWISRYRPGGGRGGSPSSGEVSCPSN